MLKDRSSMERLQHTCLKDSDTAKVVDDELSGTSKSPDETVAASS
jgi:hypothetical protein